MNDLVSVALRAVRARLDDPRRWTQGALARDAVGARVMPSDLDARCWCLAGAAQLEAELLVPTHADIRIGVRSLVMAGLVGALSAAAERVAHCPALSWANDDPDTTHDTILAIVDDALAHPLPTRCNAVCLVSNFPARGDEHCALGEGHGGPHLGCDQDGSWRSWW